MLTFVLRNTTRIKHFSFVPLVNQQQIIFRAAERPWAGWRGGSRFCYLCCSVSETVTGYIRRREARAGSCLLFLSHTHHSLILSCYRPIQEKSEDRGRALFSTSTVPRDLKEAPDTAGRARKGAKDRTY